MAESYVVVHVGVGKTGTTALQNNLLASHPALLSIGRPYVSLEWRQALESVQYDDDYDYRSARFLSLCDQARAHANERTIVLSDESIVHPAHQSLVARRLREALPTADILITIRAQHDLIISNWAQHACILKRVPGPHVNSYVPFDDWFRFQQKHMKGRGLGAGFFKRCDYYRLYKIYEQAFGSERVHLLPFELLRSDPHQYYSRIATLMRIETADVETALALPVKQRKSASRLKLQSSRIAFRLNPASTTHLPCGRQSTD